MPVLERLSGSAVEAGLELAAIQTAMADDRASGPGFQSLRSHHRVVLIGFIFAALFLIDRLGRKKLLLWGSWLMGGSMLGLSALFFWMLWTITVCWC